MSHGHWDHRSYATIPYPPDPELWAEVVEEDATCRKSLDGTLVLVKWDGETPAPLVGVTTYDHAEILAIMATPAWSLPLPPEEGP